MPREGQNSLPLLDGDQMPKDLREVGIVHGYRPTNCSALQCIRSIFVLNNETFNVWTHLISSGYFLWKLLWFYQILDIPSDSYTWPFAAYMISLCLYPLASAIAHIFFCMSELAFHICFLLDYAALGLYAFGAGLLYRSYVFPDSWYGTAFSNIFVEVSAVLTMFCTAIACGTRFLPLRQSITAMCRIMAYSVPWIWNSGPLTYRVFFLNDGAGSGDEAKYHYLYQFLFSLLIPFFYLSHLPERIAPGRFDIFFHSHQLLHVSGVVASYFRLNGALHDLLSRRDHLEKFILSPTATLSYFSFIFIANVIIVAAFTCLALRQSKKEKDKLV